MIISNHSQSLLYGYKRQRFAEEMKATGTVAAIRAEKGNLRYADFSPVDDPAIILLIDSWESQVAIDKHHASPMMKKTADLREKYDLHMMVERYLSDECMPDLDHKFIRR